MSRRIASHQNAVSSSILPVLMLLGTIGVLVALVVQHGASGAGTSPVPGIAVHRYGTTYPQAGGYDRYSYVTVGVGDAAAAGALPTKSLVYMSGTTIQQAWNTGVSYSDALANNWLLKDSGGAYVRNVAYGGYVGDIGNANYQRRFADNVASFLSANGNEGVFLDDVLLTPEGMTEGHWPAKYPNQAAWKTAMVSFMAYVGPSLRSRGFYVEANAGAWVPGDGNYTSGSTTADWFRTLAPYVDGLMCEYWVQLSSDPSQLRPSGTSSWTQFWDGWVNLEVVAQNAGTDFFGLLEGSSTSVNIMRYGKASFLLEWNGDGGAFVYHMDADPWNPEWTMDVGTPAGAKYAVGAGWRREYTGGTVILNPSPSASQTFSLGGTYTRADGTSVSSVTLSPTTALILKKSSTSTPPPPPPAAPVNSALPTISGSAQEASTLSASNGNWSNSPTGYAYQWRRCDSAGANCTSITGAAASQYALTSADVTKTVRVVVTATNSGGSASATSAASAVVGAAPAPPPPAAPVNSALPTISGSAQEASTLSASNGNWSNSPTGYAYQWRRCDSAGANCTSITGAAASQYALTSADVTKTVRVVVTATNSGGSASATSAASAVVGAAPAPPPPAAPVNSALPTISGSAQEASTLSASNGNWSNSPTGYAYQWRRCDSAGANCTSITGAAASQYALTSADVTKTVRVVVTATNSGGSASATSAASAVVGAAPAPPPPAAPVNSALPTISGSAQEASTLSASNGNWSNSPTGYAYQWRRCDSAGANCTSITGAAASQYALTSADVTKTVRVVVTATNSGGSASATSAASAVVGAAPAPPPPAAPVNSALPTISGSAQEASTLSASNGNWSNSPTGYAYQWRRCDSAGANCTSITGAAASQYALTSADVTKTVRVVVTATNSGGSASATSAASSMVAPLPAPPPPAPTNVTLPKITGSAEDGQTLSASNGTWSNSPTGYAYQWRRCDSAGANCTSITGAAASQYALTSADVTKTVRVVVIASNAGGESAVTSVPSAAVAPKPGTPPTPTNVTEPSIFGPQAVGKKVRSTTGEWTNSPTRFGYQWLRCKESASECTNIDGAVGPSYMAAPADVGLWLAVSITAWNNVGSGAARSTDNNPVRQGARSFY